MLRASRYRLPLVGVGACLLLAACDEPEPRPFAVFMEDQIAREGILAYCNQNPQETANNIECANARRAAAAIALRLERERSAELERESERKLQLLRQEMAERERIIREATLAAARAEREAYEAQWRATIAAANGNAGTDESQLSASDQAAPSLIAVPEYLRRP